MKLSFMLLLWLLLIGSNVATGNWLILLGVLAGVIMSIATVMAFAHDMHA